MKKKIWNCLPAKASGTQEGIGKHSTRINGDESWVILMNAGTDGSALKSLRAAMKTQSICCIFPEFHINIFSVPRS
jgi:hypothetical protein